MNLKLEWLRIDDFKLGLRYSSQWKLIISMITHDAQKSSVFYNELQIGDLKE